VDFSFGHTCHEMKISFILSSLRFSGGVRVIIQYANRLVERGHEISFIVPRGTIDQEITAEIDQRIKIIQSKSTYIRRANPIRLGWLTWQMALAIPRSDIIIATHTPTTAVSLIGGKLLNKGKIIWTYFDYQEMFDQRPIEQWLLKHALKWHALTLTISEACVNELHTYSYGNVINIGLGLETKSTFTPRQENKCINSPQGKKTILYIGDSRLRKGLADFLTAMEKVITVEENLEMWIVSKEKLQVNSCIPMIFYYRPTDTELVGLYTRCDIFVSSSWYEGFGLPPLEAMACGAATVITDSRGIREYAVDGVNCLIVPPKKPDLLADAILKILSMPELTDKFRENGPKTAARFSWEQATNRFEAALMTVYNDNKSLT
jgi:glycosyltransferase involved in cell wall biosynthesis